jgi:hypothetical protein
MVERQMNVERLKRMDELRLRRQQVRKRIEEIDEEIHKN